MASNLLFSCKLGLTEEKEFDELSLRMSFIFRVTNCISMPTTLAISAIISLALGIACLRLAGNGERARLQWMDLAGGMDLTLNEDHRRSQERHFTLMLSLLFMLLFAFSGSCFYWTILEIKEMRREKTTLERELESGRLEVDKMAQRFSRK